MKEKNIGLIGASSEISKDLLTLLNKEGYKTYCVTTKSNDSLKCYKKLSVQDYLEDKDKIIQLLYDVPNLIIIFFNGFLAENRDEQFPKIDEIIKTDKVNFVIPYSLTKSLNKELNNIKNFIYISSIAAVKPRYKNYIYGLTKRKLEESIKKIGLNKYLIIRFGKVSTKMSSEHRNPPFMMSSEEASEFIYSNMNKSGITYPKIGLFIISLVLKVMPAKIVDWFNY
ncbi:hypothetical protein OBA39_02895 [Acidimicrobiaceae bacterium]|nr:hypothetical protein [Acidimicrobiaceae bacterium]